MNRYLSTLLVCVFTGAAHGQSKPASQPSSRPTKPEPAATSTRDGRNVTVGRSGPAFRIPTSWVRWQDKFGGALIEDGAALEKIPVQGEFDKEIDEVLRSALSTRRCAFHGGSSTWGKGLAYSGFAMRVYLLDEAPKDIETKLDVQAATAARDVMSPRRAKARNAAGSFVRKNPKGPPPKPAPPEPIEKYRPERTKDTHWHRNRFLLDLHYGDYGAKAEIDIRLRSHGTQTLAVVFLHTDFKDQAKTKEVLLSMLQ